MKKSIILTGAAGFIGSAFLWKLNEEGISDIVLVDDHSAEKEKNLQGRKYKDYIHKDEFIKLVEAKKFDRPSYVVHMGACSSTTLEDEDYYRQNNFEYSKTLALWAHETKVPFLYASSAATYGAGERGYSDLNDTTMKLAPLNFYGKYKHLFDLWVLNEGFEDKATGIKFFNVFGPNEYHKSDMRSVVCKKYSEVAVDGCIKLFKSYKEEYKDGEQKRDFVYIKDSVDVMYWLFQNPDKTGIFNLGTGTARSWNDLANAMFAALRKPAKIDYIEMPESLRPRYQYFTEAEMNKIRQAGCDYQFRSLEEAVSDYMQYLSKEAYL